MRRWTWTLVSSIVATALAVAVNLGTGNENHLWTWLIVGALILAGSLTTVWTQRSDASIPSKPLPVSDMHNNVSGSIDGPLIQARDIGSVVTNNYFTAAPTGTPPTDHSSQLSNIPSCNPNFTGRTTLLDQIDRELNKNSSSVSICSLRGIGGVGKTQLVVEYAQRHINAYDVIWWVPSEQSELIPNAFASLAGTLGLPVGPDPALSRRRISTELRKRGKWLLIFDNADDPNSMQGYIPDFAGHVLITTRRGGFTALGTVLDIDVLDRTDSRDFLRLRIPRATTGEIEDLADLLGDLPLALEQAAAYVDATNLPPADYLNLFRARAGGMLRAGKVVGYNPGRDQDRAR